MLDIKLDDGKVLRCEAHGDMATLMGDMLLAVGIIGESIGEPDLLWRECAMFMTDEKSKRLAILAAKDALKKCEIVKIDLEGMEDETV